MKGRETADVLVVGAGVIGLSIARELKKSGVKRVTLVEKGEMGREASHAAAGMLAPQAEADKRDHFFDLCLESSSIYKEFAAELTAETGIDVEYDDAGTLYIGFSEGDISELERRYDWQSSAGLDVEMLSASETHKMEPFVSPDAACSLFFPNDSQVDNRKLIEALRLSALNNGTLIYEQAEVVSVRAVDDTVKGVGLADGREIDAGVVVLATGAWTDLIETDIPQLRVPEVRPIRGQMIRYHTAKRLFSRIIYSPRGYLVPRKDGRLLAGSTSEDAGFDDRVTEEGVASITAAATEIAPSLVQLDRDESWSGLRPMSADGFPVLGRIPPTRNLFAATGHFRNGILLAPLTAVLIAESVCRGVTPEYFRVFSANRFPKADATALV